MLYQYIKKNPITIFIYTVCFGLLIYLIYKIYVIIKSQNTNSTLNIIPRSTTTLQPTTIEPTTTFQPTTLQPTTTIEPTTTLQPTTTEIPLTTPPNIIVPENPSITIRSIDSKDFGTVIFVVNNTLDMMVLKGYIMLVDINTLTIIRIYPNGAVSPDSGPNLPQASYIDKNEYARPLINGHYYQFFSNGSLTDPYYFVLDKATSLSNVTIST